MSNYQSQDFSNKKARDSLNVNNSDDIKEKLETKKTDKEFYESNKLKKSKQNESLKSQKIHYDTNNFDENDNNLRKKFNKNSNSERSLSEEISNSEDDIFYKKNIKNSIKDHKKQNTPTELYSKGNRKFPNKDEYENKNNYTNGYKEKKNFDNLEKDKIIQNEKNSNRSRNQNRNSNQNDIESRLSSDRNTYYTFNEKYNIKKANFKNKQFNNIESKEFKKKFINNNDNINKKSIQRYEELEENNDLDINEENKENINNIIYDTADNNNSKKLKSKNSRNKDLYNSKGNSPVFIRKSIKYAAYGESFIVSESDNNSRENEQGENHTEEDSINENNCIYK